VAAFASMLMAENIGDKLFKKVRIGFVLN